MTYTDLYNPTRTPQSQMIPGRENDMSANRGGGVSFNLDPWKQLDRFLILGSDSPTYYAGAREMTRDNASNIVGLIKENGPRVVSRAVEISKAGRAYKNDPAIFVLALAITGGDVETKQAARQALPQVARTGTHLFSFVEMVDALGGWGSSKVKAVRSWYESKDAKNLAYQITKYQQRNGWSHRDVLRKVHPKGTYAHDIIYDYIVGGNKLLGVEHDGSNFASYLTAVEMAKKATSAKEVANLIRMYNIPREVIPTNFLNSLEVWDALLQPGGGRFMSMTAMIRNLGAMTSKGFLTPMSEASLVVANRLTDFDALKYARVHPMQVLAAMLTYRNGHGSKGNLAWNPVGEIVDALDEAFYLSFGTVEPTGKRRLIALDVSGSMDGFWSWGYNRSEGLMGVPGLTPRVASAAMAMVTVRTEKRYQVMGFSRSFMELNITPRQRLDDVLRTISGLPFSSTDCAQPMLYAHQKMREFDSFEIYTDNETNSGRIHPVQALDNYKRALNIDARVAVVGMTSTGHSIADPQRIDMLDVVGFDTATPRVIADFVAGNI